MSNITLNKPFKHFNTLDTFISKKVSTNKSNTSYTQNGTTYAGTPEIMWESIAFINDVGQIWNRGRFYSSQKYLNKLAVISKDTSYDYTKPIITIIDRSYAKLYDTTMSVYNEFPGILPSIVVAPGIVENANDINKVYALIDKGCDVLSTAYKNHSVYDATQTDALNYAEIQNDIVQVQEWLIDHSIFTNCYMYPNIENSKAESNYIAKYEEYGIVESIQDITSFDPKMDILNDNDIDNMLFKAYNGNKINITDALLTKVIEAKKTNIWILLIVDSSNITGNIRDLIGRINSYVNNGDVLYMQVNEALKVFAPRFNICRSSELPFRVYKDGTVDAILSTKSQQKLFDALKDKFVEYYNSQI